MRSSGILLHISSLPSPYGIGTFGRQAYNFVDFLRAAGQRYWQILPLGPTSFGDSPYQSFSVFAGNPYFIDLDLICEGGLLAKEECDACDWGSDAKSVDYAKIFHSRFTLLWKAYLRFQDKDALAEFRKENADWVEDYALYMAVKAKMGLRPWTQWEDEIKLRKPDAVRFYQLHLANEIEYYVFLQYLFFKQWFALKTYANDNEVEIIGDMPIYVAPDSADAWANSEIFLLDEYKNPIDVAGVPPDGFSATGQLWGNPLYRWDYLKQTDYAWWVKRLQAAGYMHDVTRIDHFRGFESYYAVPYGDKTAENGEWRKGPGYSFFESIMARLGDMRLIAEDLGYLTEEVHELRRSTGYPGMKILEFAFDSREESDYLPHNYDKDCVVYTGTHDNDTVRGWFSSAPGEDVAFARRYLNITGDQNGTWEFIRAAVASVADLAVVQMQDYLELDSHARMNTPSTIGTNWRWRLSPGALTPKLAQQICEMTQLYGR
ncbi:4-alpha-glucanotransferase [Hydrogenoanaerobacterium sp.]|uniref:4-alpha-glucanotransferase n=1 Tax=Hydrogenoanaerobacterium sp. TaxID=2953763 RepID=UPI00289A162F|nr:4-alpha-glucanotransferase [Hydrogenoanaerobacterium sp.]